MKFQKFLFLLLLITIFPISVSAKSGCCSHHGGVSHCNTSIGKYVCNDGSVSPTCTCEKIITNKKTTTTSKTKKTSISSKLVTTRKTTNTTGVVMNINTNSNKIDDNKNDSNDIGSTLGGLGIVGATIAIIANRKSIFKKK